VTWAIPGHEYDYNNTIFCTWKFHEWTSLLLIRFRNTCFSLQISKLVIWFHSYNIQESQTAVTICNAYFTNSLALRPSGSLVLFSDGCPFSSAHCHNITLTLIISVFAYTACFRTMLRIGSYYFFKWHRSVGLCEGRGVCFLWSKNVHSFYFTNSAQNIYFLFQQYLYYNHPYMLRYICIIFREFQSCTSLKLRFYIIKISLKIIKLKHLYGCCW